MDLMKLCNSLETQAGMADFLENLTPVETVGDLNLVTREINEIGFILQDHPDLVTKQALDAIVDYIMLTPLADDDSDKQSPAQEMSLRMIRLLGEIASFTENQGRQAIERLDYIAGHSDDYDAIRVAVVSIGAASNRNGMANPFGVEALRKQARTNSNSVIRIAAREFLYTISKDHPEIVAAAMAAQRQGMEDDDPIARLLAISMMASRVESPTCMMEELHALRTSFERAAARKDEAPETVHVANQAIISANDRIATGRTGPVFP
ncbi:MAG TPA: hypothetical protein VIF12_04095 [Micavibrio sp.]|jgi:hypothetical protein